MKDKKRRLNLVSSTLTFTNGSVKVLDIPLLRRIFGVPEPLWIKKGLDYEIKLNAPYDMLQSCLHTVSNFGNPYLLIKQNEIVFPSSGDSMPIRSECGSLNYAVVPVSAFIVGVPVEWVVGDEAVGQEGLSL